MISTINETRETMLKELLIKQAMNAITPIENSTAKRIEWIGITTDELSKKLVEEYTTYIMRFNFNRDYNHLVLSSFYCLITSTELSLEEYDKLEPEYGKQNVDYVKRLKQERPRFYEMIQQDTIYRKEIEEACKRIKLSELDKLPTSISELDLCSMLLSYTSQYTENVYLGNSYPGLVEYYETIYKKEKGC